MNKKFNHALLAACISLAITDCNDNDSTNTEKSVEVLPELQLIDYTPASSEKGSSDASGAIALDDNYMVVGDDEENVLRIYPRAGGDQVLEFDFNLALLSQDDIDEGETEAKELDVEALTRYDSDKLLIIGSHGNKKSGDDAVDDRGHIIAVQFDGTGAETRFTILGKYSHMEADLIDWDSENIHAKGADYFGIATAAADGIAPESVSGMSIEGAAVSHDASQLLLGFRAPQTDQTTRNKALIVPVNNYQALIAEEEDTAIFGEPIELNLGGRGIRDISQWGEQFLIVAGPASASVAEVTENFALYTWSGESADSPVQIDNEIERLRADNAGSIETIVQSHNSDVSSEDIQLLLDNGDSIWEGESDASKDLDPEYQKFQGAYLPLWNAVQDIQAPQLQSMTPENATQGVNTDTRIELSFDEGIILNEGSVSVYQGDDLIASYGKSDPEVSVVFNTLKVTPTSKLDYTSEYRIEISDGYVSDNYNNSYQATGALSEFLSAGEPTPLAAGEIVFVGANAEAPDAIAFMLKKDINGGTEIMFSDRDYINAQGTFWNTKNDELASNEGVFRWTADRDMQAGDIITIQTDTTLSPIADVGQVLGSPSGLGKTETVYAMIGTQVEELSDGSAGLITDPGIFIAAISLGGLDDGNEIPTEIAHLQQYFHPVGADTDEDLADQTNALYDADNCGRTLDEITENVFDSACWKVTFKDDGATGFPLYEQGSLFEQALIFDK